MNHLEIKISQAASVIAKAIKAKLVPMVVGSPGVGKSQIIHQIADEYGLKLIDLRLSQCDPTDLLGFPTIVGERAGYLPMNTFPIEGDTVPEGFNGWMICLDELNSAVPAVQAAAYKLILDRMVGIYPLHSKVAIVAAGNLESDNAVVQPMSTALQSRLLHIQVYVDAKEWCVWASGKGIDHRITSYINFKPAAIYTFDPNHTDKTYACPRTWEFAHRILQVTEDNDPDRLPLLTGALSEGVAREFMGFLKIHLDIPKIDEIIQSPETVRVPDEPSVLYALSGSLAQNSSTDNLDKVIKYVKRLPMEFQVITLRETIQRSPKIVSHPAIQEWINSNASELF